MQNLDGPIMSDTHSRLTYLTYCRVASQFTVCNASAAFSILAESSLHCFLSFASSVILTRSSVEWSLKWSISPRSLFSTIGSTLEHRMILFSSLSLVTGLFIVFLQSLPFTTCKLFFIIPKMNSQEMKK